MSSLGSMTVLRYPTRTSAAAGRSRAARQPPNDPASRPPATASSTASAIAPIVTDADMGTAIVVWAAVGPPISVPLAVPPGPTTVWGPPSPPLAAGTVADSRGATWSMIATPAKPRPTPTRPPRMPVVTDSPKTWATIRLLRQPRALSVPNSGTRRATAAMVSRLATANAAIRTSTASHLPSAPASLAALAADPVISLARSDELVTVACGSRCRISPWTAAMSAALAAVTYTVLTWPVMGLPVAGLVARAWARASGMYRSGGLLPCGWLTRPMT